MFKLEVIKSIRKKPFPAEFKHVNYFFPIDLTSLKISSPIKANVFAAWFYYEYNYNLILVLVNIYYYMFVQPLCSTSIIRNG